MEIRGIGVIDVQAMFGIGAVSFSKSIDLIMELVSTESDEPLDRIGLEDHSVEILGVPVPCQSIPIKPGRNLAIIVEVASRNLSLKKAGFNAARELISVFQE
jgi:HPr kinase/phosphorylase